MKKTILAALAAAFAAFLCMPAAAETFTTSDGVLSVELPNDNWKEIEDTSKWVTFTDGANMVTIDHFSNGEKLPDMTVADDHFVNVYQGVFSTQNEVFIITGGVVDAEKIPEVTNMILSAKVLIYDTKTAVRKDDAPSHSDFSVAPVSKTMYVTADGLNVRKGWSTDDPVIGSYANGAAVQITGLVQKNGEDYGWYQVSYEGNTGYVSAGFLSDNAPEQKGDSYPDTYTGNAKTVYEEDGSAFTLYEATDGYWYDKNGTRYVRQSDSEFQVYEGTKRVSVYPPSSEPSTGYDYTGANETVYDESGSTYTLYECTDGLWRTIDGSAYTRVSDDQFQAYEGTKRVTIYDNSVVTNDEEPDYSDDNSQDSGDSANGVVTAYEEDGTAVTLYENSDGLWYDADGTAYVRHSDSDFQVYEGNRHLTVY